jgi:ribosomal protein S18 acetylase RimI-like enzyme
MSDFIVRDGGPGDLDALAPLWQAVHRHHAASMPELAPYVTDGETWGARRALYAELLEDPGTTLLLAYAHADDGGQDLVAYAMSHVFDRAGSWLDDTWVTGPRIGEIESLAVREDHRGSGLGTRLITELERRLHAAGIDDIIIGLLPGNDGARRLYERRGYRPTWMYMSRLDGRS